MTGSATPCSRQRSRIRLMPEPMFSTTSIRYSMLNSRGFRGMLLTPRSPSLIPAGNPPGLTTSMRSLKT